MFVLHALANEYATYLTFWPSHIMCEYHYICVYVPCMSVWISRSSYPVYYRVLYMELIDVIKAIPPAKQTDVIDVRTLATFFSSQVF